MNSFQISAILVQDGVTTGAIYALLGMALVLLFAVTRVLFFAQGEFVVFGALSLVWLHDGQVPATLWLVVGLAFVAGVLDMVAVWRDGSGQRGQADQMRQMGKIALMYWLLPAAAAAAALPFARLGMLPASLVSLTIVTTLGALLHRLVFQPMRDASVLALLIVSIGVHFVLSSLSLLFFGVEGFRSPAFWSGAVQLGWMRFNGQSLIVVLTTTLLIVALALLFSRTLYGKALRATASHATGARLLAVSVAFSGRMAFTLAAFIGGLCGLLIGPIVTLYYDSGLLIGLKGFVAAVVGGLHSYALTLLGALGIGIVEAFASFKFSAYKEALVFLLILPVLLWLSLRGRTVEQGR